MKLLQIHPDDNVAVALEDIQAGEELQLDDQTVTAFENIARGHKVALRDIHVDEDIIKYGESLGEATKEIVAGDYVHVHNLDSKRGRGDWED